MYPRKGARIDRLRDVPVVAVVLKTSAEFMRARAGETGLAGEADG